MNHHIYIYIYIYIRHGDLAPWISAPLVYSILTTLCQHDRILICGEIIEVWKLNLKLLAVLTAALSCKAGCRETIERRLQQSRCIYGCKCVIETLPTNGLSGVSPPRKFNYFLASHCVEPEGSLPQSREHTTSIFPEPDWHNLHSPSIFFKSYFNVIRPSMPRSSKWSLYFYFPTETLCISRLPRSH